jgi:CDP-diacylglycerol--inositol 3-phosphatidyltransferase
VRTYYKYRLFMGFCCVCCEVLYLCLYGLAFPETRELWRLDGVRVALPVQILALEPGQFLLSMPRHCTTSCCVFMGS